MASKLTNTIIESYVDCKYKAYLRFGGETGEICDYEHLQTEARNVSQTALAEKVLSQHASNDVLQDVLLSASVLKSGAKFLLNASLETDDLSLRFDGLKRTSARSKLGDFSFAGRLCLA